MKIKFNKCDLNETYTINLSIIVKIQLPNQTIINIEKSYTHYTNNNEKQPEMGSVESDLDETLSKLS